MGILSSIGKLLKRVFEFIKKLLKKIWPIILIALIVLACMYGPALIPMITSGFSSFFGAISTGLGSMWSGLVSFGGSAMTWLKSTTGDFALSDWAKLAAGAYIIADPEGAIDKIGDVISAVVDAIPTWVWFAGGATLLIWLLKDKSSGSDTTVKLVKG